MSRTGSVFGGCSAAAIVAVGLIASSAAGAQRQVPGQYATIQAAINAAVAGDEVVIAPGTYSGSGNRNITLAGKAITVRSSDPANPAVVAATVIDCQGSTDSRRRGFRFTSGEGAASVLAGLTIRNGYGPNEDWEGMPASSGGAIYIRAASPTIRDCRVENCQGDYWGGGLWMYQSDALIERCVFVSCSEPGGIGGAVCCIAGSPTFRLCRFEGNSADYGGAVYSLTCSPTFVACLFGGNSATYAGGALRCQTNSQVSLRSCLLVSNHASDAGGGMHITTGVATIVNCTFGANTTLGAGGAVFAGQSSEATINSSILWLNTSVPAMEAAVRDGASLSVSYSDVRNGLAGVSVGAGSLLAWGTGNFSDDPLFVDMDGPDDDPGTWADNDCHLQLTSPCLGRADPALTPLPAETDIDRQTRKEGSRIDVGCDEAWPLVHNTTQDLWYPQIQSAIDAGSENDEIVVAPGTYYENVRIDKALTLRSTAPKDPAVVAATIIDGAGRDAVVVVDAPSTVSGFTLTHGHSGSGGGLRNSISYGLSTVSHCAIIRNRALDGGGVYNNWRSSIRVTDCMISHNQASRDGGGVCDSSTDAASVVITGCVIASNTAGSGGGIDCGSDCGTKVVGCDIRGNSAAGEGGGIRFRNCLHVAVNNCMIAGNVAAEGGGIWRKDSYLTVRHCTVVGNLAEKGGGMFGDSTSYPDYVNLLSSIVRANSATLGPQIALDGGPVPASDDFTVSYSHVEGGLAGLYIGQNNWSIHWSASNITEDPLFVDPDGPDNDPATWADNDYHLTPDSPCRNSGDWDFVPEPGETDIDGQPRVLYGLVDIGADEFLLRGDIDADGYMNVFDIFMVAEHWNTQRGDPGYDPSCDLDGDGFVNVFDIFVLAENWNTSIWD